MDVPAKGKKPAKKAARRRSVNLALQGGGAHGAYTWGVLDKLLEDGRLDIDGLSGTSAGSLNAVILAHGQMTGGTDGAREALENFWRRIAEAGSIYGPVKRLPWETWFAGWNMDENLFFNMFDSMTRMVSPYQFNPFDVNPLRDILSDTVDFEALAYCEVVKLFLSATNVRTGKVKVFHTKDVTLDVVMASACLPMLFKAVEIDGDHFWDGGYMGNPALFPFFYHTDTRDVLIVHINPIEREDVPKRPSDIHNRINEITFNSSLIKELRAISFVQKLLNEGWLRDEFKHRLKNVLVHSIRADRALADLSVASKFNTDWDFLRNLRDRGRETAARWLKGHFDCVGRRSTVDLRREFLGFLNETPDLETPINENKC